MKSYEKYWAAAAVALAAGGSGCCGEVVTGSEQLNADANAEDNHQVEVDAGPDIKPEQELLTRGKLFRDMVFDVMGYSGECGKTYYSDVPAQGEVCRGVEVMHDLGMTGDNFNGLFRPNDGVNRVELFKLITLVMGYVPFNAVCLSGIKDVSSKEWYSQYVGAMCENGYPVVDEQWYAHPADSVTVDSWKIYEQKMKNMLEGPVARGELARLVSQLLLIGSTGLPCKSYYTDVADNSSVCEVVNYVSDQKVMEGYKNANGELTGLFGVNDHVNYGQMAKIDAIATGVNVLPPTGCSGAEANQWYSTYMDSLCGEGLADKTWGAKASEDVSRKSAYKLVWDSSIWMNKHLDGGK